jgi:hypothetical protein
VAGASAAQYSITGTVPGDLITDLQNAGLIGDPLYELNWLNSSIWDQNEWTYSKSTTLPAATRTRLASAASTMLLVFDGVKMGAKISVNGASIGMTSDEYRRYEFTVPSSLIDSNNGAVKVGDSRTRSVLPFPPFMVFLYFSLSHIHIHTHTHAHTHTHTLSLSLSLSLSFPLLH